MVAEPHSERAPLFDRAHLQSYAGDDAGLEAELIDLMCAQAERCLAIMETAQERVDWRTATHTLKGAARGVGAFALADACDLMEESPASAWAGARLEIDRVYRETVDAFRQRDL